MWLKKTNTVDLEWWKIIDVGFSFFVVVLGGGLRTISESVSQREQLATGKGRHAVIRRHQSMYIHPRATELLPPFNVSSSNEVPTFNMHEVSGKSEVRPIVTLKRSKTTVGQSSGFANGNNPTLHYRGASTLQPPRTFRSNSNAPKKPLFDHNHNIYGTNKRGSSLASGSKAHHHHYANAHLLDDICEFQVLYSHSVWKAFKKSHWTTRAC